MRLTICLLLAALLSSCSAKEERGSPSPSEPAAPLPTLALFGGEERLEVDIPTLRAQLETVQFRVFNPEWKQEIEYRAFRLQDVLRLAGIPLDGRDGDLIFHCADGYASIRPIKMLSKMKLMLAFEEVGAQKWTPLPGHRDAPIAGPFYVLSQDAADFEAFPWPWQVTGIELVDFTERYAALVPVGAADDSAEMRGFRAFRSKNCLSCHSINLVGGQVGPELNVPKNITEYRDRDLLKAWIRDASAFRARTLMPPNPDLSDAELDDILAYLAAMKEHKTNTGEGSAETGH